ncbi:SAM-dependent methyltransferase [Kutzneria chonburiensis]|uniref:SAM-dependent methyltransferase n=1 Tax=Kutzneria chonburiensis TaxID=1483604 RepID=A0ABV6N979_9PSEU|nr:class I SAM-dependent methyltransferase [Kutzneria chonburiensis]
MKQESVALAMQARQRLEGMRAEAQLLSLLTAVHEKGWTEFLLEPRTVEELAGFARLPAERVQDVLEALQANGIVEQEDGKVRLTVPFATVAADDAWIPLGDKLAQIEMEVRQVRALVEDSTPLALTEADALVVANAVGGHVTDVTRAVYAQLLAQLPDLAAQVRAGRWLDVGCGVACATLTLATTVPEMHGVAVELVPAVAAEAKRRAEAFGVADRVEIRQMDARDVPERDEFVGAFWAQPFFPAAIRPATLAMIRRALKPGGKLFIQELEAVPTEQDRPAWTVRRLIAHGQQARFGPSAEELAEEAVAVGFTLDRIAGTDFGRMVVVTK